MATPTATVTEYCAALVKSRLVREDEVPGIRSAWEADTRGTDADVESFRKFLVKKQHLTNYHRRNGPVISYSAEAVKDRSLMVKGCPAEAGEK